MQRVAGEWGAIEGCSDRQPGERGTCLNITRTRLA